ncbi:hypothetical protein [Massilia sp. YMA4]|uniref:hypothetical protein n=1 Tax=Massilia sp. YMA4 TaxID=1593482 RepID=UPI0015831BC3|nr:hypothetical protein [Massilia sp. YMA4]
MWPDAGPWSALPANAHLIAISVFGGYVLFGLKLAEHFMRAAADKMPLRRYVVCFSALFVVLPVLGGSMTAIYLMNGDKLSPILALQAGLTSPAIVQSLIIAAAHSVSKNSAPAAHSGQ